MSETIHQRAEQLIAQERIEAIPPSEREWLESHFEQCTACAAVARNTAEALRSLRAVSVELPRGITEKTQFRVRLRAQELSEREPRRRGLWVACAISWAFGLASAPYVWRAFAWFGQRAGLPKIVWELSFALWWTIPALVAAVVLLMENARRGEEPEWMRQGQ